MENPRQEESDMLNVINGMKNVSTRIYGSVRSFFLYPFRNKGRLLLCVVIAVALFCIVYAFKRPYFRSSVTITHIRIDNHSCSEMILLLDQSIDGHNNVGLATHLGIDPGTARAVRNIEFKHQNEQLANRFTDSVHILLPFRVEVDVFRREVFDTLQTAILNYLESNEFARRRKMLDLESLQKTELWLNQEIMELDSLKRIVNQSIVPRGSGQGIIFGEPLDPVIVYRRALELFDRRTKIEKAETFNNSFEVMIGFNKSAKRADPPLIFFILAGLITGFLAAALWLRARDRRQRSIA